MTSRFMLIFSFILQTSGVWAQDTIPVNHRARHYFSPMENFMSRMNHNPAINYYAHSFPISELKLGWEQEKADKAPLPQLGSETENFTFHAFSYMPLTANSKTWGSAYFNKGTKKNVAWNETSDFLTVYPYVMADSLGGNLSFEEYYFAGGYARELRHISWGVHASYRALIEYRNLDPRPKNVVSDLKASAGISVKTRTRYSVGLAVHAGKYKQTNEVKFYNELGSIKIFHLSGLGMDYYRFSGNQTSVFYNGHRYGASIELFSRVKSGFNAALAYERFSFEKIISSLNDLPLNKLKQDEIKTEFGYTSTLSGHQWGIKANINHQNRQGTENLFGNATANIYEMTGKAEQLSVKTTDATLTGIFGQNSGKQRSWYITPRIGIQTFGMKYLDPAREMQLAYLTRGVNLSVSVSSKNSTFTLNLDGESRQNTDAYLQITEPDIKQQMAITAVNTVYTNLSADSRTTDISFRWDHALPKNKGIFLKLSWQHSDYKSDLQQNALQAHCGLVF